MVNARRNAFAESSGRFESSDVIYMDKLEFASNQSNDPRYSKFSSFGSAAKRP